MKWVLIVLLFGGGARERAPLAVDFDNEPACQRAALAISERLGTWSPQTAQVSLIVCVSKG